MHALDRRQALAGAAASALSLVASARGADKTAPALKGNIKQSIVFWCFNAFGEKWNVAKTCEVARSLGCRSVELVDPEHFATLKKHDLTCAIAPNGMPGAPYVKGFNNPRYHEEVITRMKKAIDACAEA